MTEAAFFIEPADTLMFRDGRPFNQSDDGASEAHSLFPPPLPTLVGAMRYTFATMLGFGRKDVGWPEDKLGSGTDWQKPGTLGNELRFGAVLIGKKNADGTIETYFPLPAHVFGSRSRQTGRMTPQSLLRPTEPVGFASDLGADVPFPRLPHGQVGLKPLDGFWVDRLGMTAICEGRVPDPDTITAPFVIADDRPGADGIFVHESRVGIGIDQRRRISDEGNLYISSHLRLAEGFGFIHRVWHELDEIDGFSQRLGGEHRFAHFEPCTIPALGQPADRTLNIGETYAAIALSPVRLTKEPVFDGSICGLPGRLKSLAMPKPMYLGGWDSKARRPLAMVTLAPAGSVFFMEYKGADPWRPEPLAIGRSTEWGFGEAIMARWPQ